MTVSQTPNAAKDPSNGEGESKHTLSESLRSYEGTPTEARIIEELAEWNIDPREYDTGQHDNYRGIPSSEPQAGGVDRPSPIVHMFDRAEDDEEIVRDTVNPLTTMIHAGVELRAKLNLVDLINAEVLRDATTGDILGFTIVLSGSGSGGGTIFLGPKDLEIEPLESIRDLDTIVPPEY